MTRVWMAAWLAVVAAGCGRESLADAQPSSVALARAVLAALASRDEARLRALAVTAPEFERQVWPALPAARRERNLPWSYVWSELRQKSDTMLRRTLKAHGGRAYPLRDVRFDGASTDHGHYRVHRGTVLVVGDGAGTRELRVLGSMIEADDAWKVFSYLADP